MKVTTQRAGLIILEPHQELYEAHGLSSPNGVITVEKGKAFKILVANFTNYPKRIQRNQIIARALPHPTFVAPTHVTLAEVLGVVDTENPVEKEETSDPKELPSSADSWGTTPDKPSAKTLDLNHVPEELRERFRQVLLKYDFMWDGSLGQINTTEHRIQLQPDAKPVYQRPYRTGPQALKFVVRQCVLFVRMGLSAKRPPWAP